MKALILAAGFGTRLERDLKSVTGEPYAHLIGVPKPLLPVGGKPLASHWLQSISEVEAVESVLVVVSHPLVCELISILGSEELSAGDVHQKAPEKLGKAHTHVHRTYTTTPQ